ncbi:copper amine oxidase N-terminal domain-containing protein [Acetivibrio mesophilus]|uniref:Copper amine oxidase N-terminal domain-containing protein n=2 Tax=Acetivibrio mesophilus TaxID=2487273 RepID=A0A4Q0I3S4_9FIRM|nr:copper amine oxidase N-terminal domain-containing protein [Acetivibrio mesophilus]RXE57542.1 copper amine oxidase N-terminal domain-containing protein [Acetivibrio mesophilus]
MKRLAALMLTVFILTIFSSSMTYAINIPLRVVVDGEEVNFPDAQPFIDANGRTQTPSRFIGEAIGAIVTWDGNAKKAVFKMSGTTLELFIGKKEYQLNGQKKQMDTEALLIDGRTFVPARYVAEAFGATVRWKNEIKTVYIDTDDIGKVVDEGDTREVAGFIVPKNIDLSVSAIKDDLNYEAVFTIDFLRKDVEKQKDDMEKILLQRFSEDTVKEIMNVVRSKVKDTDLIEARYFYDTKTSQYIFLAKSWPMRGSTITLYILIKGVKPRSLS